MTGRRRWARWGLLLTDQAAGYGRRWSRKRRRSSRRRLRDPHIETTPELIPVAAVEPAAGTAVAEGPDAIKDEPLSPAASSA